MMPPLYRLLSLRYLLHRWDRAALIVASIALGVATLVSTRILNQCIEAAARDTTTPVGGADLYVTNGEGGVLRSVADELRAANIPGLKSVQPLVFDRVSLPGLDDRAAVLIGADVSPGALHGGGGWNASAEWADGAPRVTLHDWKLTAEWSGEGPLFQLGAVMAAVQANQTAKAEELWNRIPGRFVVVTRPIFEERKRRGGANQPLVLKHGTTQVECLVIGVVDLAPDSPLAALGQNIVGMEVGQAARALRPSPAAGHAAAVGGTSDASWDASFPPRANRFDLFLTPGADRDAVAAAVAAVVGPRASVRTPETQGRGTQEIISGLQIGFFVCSAGAMIVGLFLVYNALAVTVAERRPDIGILRSIGATRWQVIRLFAAAAAVLGVVGSGLGIPLGWGLAEAALTQFREELATLFLSPEVSPTRLTWATVGWAVLAGVGTAVFAALVPAVQAAADDPADVVRRTAGGSKNGVWKFAHRLACYFLLGGGLAMILTRHALPPRVGSVGGMMLVLVGLLLAAPVIVGLFIRLLQPLIRATCGVTVRLAADNLSRAPARTGVVIGALGAGVALMFQTAGVGRSNEEPVIAWLNDVITADHFVFSGSMSAANSSSAPMTESDVRAVAGLPAVDRVMAIRYSRPEYNGTVVYLIALDAEAYARASRARVPGGATEWEKFLDLPDTDDVLVSDNFALKHGVRPGDRFALPGPNGPVTLRAAGTIKDFSWSRGTVFMDRKRYAARFGDDLVDIAHVYLKPRAGGSGQLEQLATSRGLVTTDRDALRKFLTELINRVYLLAYLQQIVVGVVAALGVVTALLISVLQRKRELGLLLALGATPGQVLRSVLAEAVLMGVFGTALGVLIGIPLEWYVLRVVLVEESGFVFDVVLPWRQALGIAGAAIATATIAGLIPALHAVRTRITDAIQYE